MNQSTVVWVALGDNRNPVGNAGGAALQEGRTQQLRPAGSTDTGRRLIATGQGAAGTPGLAMSGPQAEPVSADRVTATLRIAAPAYAIFLLVCDPARHVDIDGSGMLQAAPDARPLTEVGQTFDMDMDRRPLGDIPNMAEYKVRCTVTRLIPGRLIEWTVRAIGKPPAGHVYGWQIEPLSDGACLVSNYCDWTNIGDELRAKFRWPVVPADRLQRSVDNLERIATRVVE